MKRTLKVKPIEIERKERLIRQHEETKITKSARHRKEQRERQFSSDLKLDMPVLWMRNRSRDVKNTGSRTNDTFHKRQEKYSGEMQLRELKARQETERKKKRVAPAYNKGGLVYISDETDLSDLGRKK